MTEADGYKELGGVPEVTPRSYPKEGAAPISMMEADGYEELGGGNISVTPSAELPQRGPPHSHVRWNGKGSAGVTYLSPHRQSYPKKGAAPISMTEADGMEELGGLPEVTPRSYPKNGATPISMTEADGMDELDGGAGVTPRSYPKPRGSGDGKEGRFEGLRPSAWKEDSKGYRPQPGRKIRRATALSLDLKKGRRKGGRDDIASYICMALFITKWCYPESPVW